MEPKKKKIKSLEMYFQNFSVISSQEAITQDQLFYNSQSSLQSCSQNELETTPMLSKVVNFESATIPNVGETSISTDNVCDLGTIDCFPSRPILKNFPITNGRKFVSKWYSYFS